MLEVLEAPQKPDADPYLGLGLGVYNQVQIELARRAGEGNREKEQRWFDLNSGKTGRFRALLNTRPDIVGLIKTDRNRAFEEIEKFLGPVN